MLRLLQGKSRNGIGNRKRERKRERERGRYGVALCNGKANG